MRARLKPCHLLYASSLFSGCSSGILLLTLPWSILESTGNALEIGLLNIVPAILIIAIMPLFSYWLDTSSIRKIYLTLLIFSLMIIFLFSIVSFFSGENRVLYFGAFCFAALMRGLEQVARTSLGKELVDEKKYLDLNRTLEFIRQSIPLLSGLLFVLLTQLNLFYLLIICLGLNGFSFTFLFLIQPVEVRKSHELIISPEKFISKTKMFKKNLYFLILVFPYVAIMTQNVIYPSHIHQLLNLPKLYYALMVIPYAVGAYLASYLAKYTAKIPNDLLFPLLFFLYISVTLLLILIPSLPVFYFALFVFPLLQGIIRIGRLTLLMQTYPSHLTARIIGFGDSAAIIGFTSLALICAIVIDAISVIAAWWVIFLMLAAALILLLNISAPKN